MKKILPLVLSLILFFTPTYAFASGGGGGGGGRNDDNEDPYELEVEINTGPEFTNSDHTKIKQCALYYSSNFFPFDFLYKGFNSPSSGECPKVEFFGHEHQFCEFLTLYKNLVSPGIKLSMIIYGIFHL